MKKTLVSLLLAGSLISGTTTPAFANQPFPDLNPASHSWAMESVSFMVQKGIVKGDEKGRFNPDAKVTKAEFVTMVHRLFDTYRPQTFVDSQFLDVPKNHWAYKEISDMSQKMNFGHFAYFTEAGQKFEPDKPMTRMGAVNLIPDLYDLVEDDDAYSIVSGMRDLKVIVSADDYSDNRYDYGVDMTNNVFPFVFYPAPDGTFDAQDDYSYTVSLRVASLQKAGIMTAYKGEFEAADPLTRAEAVTILHRLYKYLQDNQMLSLFSSK